MVVEILSSIIARDHLLVYIASNVLIRCFLTINIVLAKSKGSVLILITIEKVIFSGKIILIAAKMHLLSLQTFSDIKATHLVLILVLLMVHLTSLLISLLLLITRATIVLVIVLLILITIVVVSV